MKRKKKRNNNEKLNIIKIYFIFADATALAVHSDFILGVAGFFMKRIKWIFWSITKHPTTLITFLVSDYYYFFVPSFN
jgi:hypothetical protein